MTRPPIMLAGFLSAILLLQSAGISAQGAERGGEGTSVRVDVITSTAPASSWVPQWFPKAPVLPPPKGAVIRAVTVEELLTAVDRAQPGGTILLAEGHYRVPWVMVLQHVNNLVHGEILSKAAPRTCAPMSLDDWTTTLLTRPLATWRSRPPPTEPSIRVLLCRTSLRHPRTIARATPRRRSLGS